MCAVSCLRNPLVIKIINPIVFPFTLRFLIDLCLIHLHMGTISFFIWTLSSNPIIWDIWHAQLVQFISVAQSCPTLCDAVNHSTPGLPVHHQLPELTQTHMHRVGDAIQPSHPLSSPSPPAPNPSQHQGLFQWVNSSHRWPKYWSFSLSISPSNEHPGLISFGHARVLYIKCLLCPGLFSELCSPSGWSFCLFQCQYHTILIIMVL